MVEVSYDFEVKREKVFCEDGTYVGKEAIRRVDTGEVLGVVGESYELLEHKKAVEAAEKAIEGIGTFSRDKISLPGNGARLYINYNFPNKSVSIGKLKDNTEDFVNPQLILTNSYDGSQEYGFMLGAYRVVCSNGLVVGQDIFRIRRKHTSGLDIDVIMNKAQEASDMFFNRVVPKYKELSTEQILDTEAFMNYLKEKKVPVRLVDKMAEEITMDVITKWDVYNKFTRYLTHDYNKSEDRRQELGKIVAKAFGI